MQSYTSSLSFFFLYSFVLLFLPVPDTLPKVLDNKLITKPIKGFLQLQSSNIIAVVTSVVAAALLCGERAANLTFKISISCSSSSTYNVPHNGQLATDPKNIDLIIWGENVMCPCYCIHAVHHMMGDFTQFRGSFRVKDVQFRGFFRKTFR